MYFPGLSHPTRRSSATWAVAGALAVATVTAGCRLAGSGSPDDGASGGATSSATDRGTGGTEPGVLLTGRVVDARSGLPVRDAGVLLAGVDSRSITGPDGGFRFDGVPAGALTIVVGPVDDYVVRSWIVKAGIGTGDIGFLSLYPASPATTIDPDYGGAVTGCPGTSLTIASHALPETTEVRLTCLEGERQIPAPAPAGRLPLVVADVSPGGVETSGIARLVVGLPAQPRYAVGVPLELLRLDLDRLVWSPVGVLTVDQGGDSASGDLKSFGTYLVASPPFGAFASDVGAPAVPRFQIALSADGAPTSSVPTGTMRVYAAFDYAGMDGTPVTIRTMDERGESAFEETHAYSGHGHAAVEMMTTGAESWPLGTYVTAVLVGQEGPPVHEVSWSVTDQPASLGPTEPAWPTSEWASGAAPGWSSAGRCPPPAGWWAYIVQPGDTPSTLAARTGVDLQELLAANCLTRDQLDAGEMIYLPRPPTRLPSPSGGSAVATARPGSSPPTVPQWPVAGDDGRSWPTPIWPTAAWPTQGWPTESWLEPWPKPSVEAATAAPRPTVPLPPQVPTSEPPPQVPVPTPWPQAPTPKWATLPPEAPTP